MNKRIIFKSVNINYCFIIFIAFLLVLNLLVLISLKQSVLSFDATTEKYSDLHFSESNCNCKKDAEKSQRYNNIKTFEVNRNQIGTQKKQQKEELKNIELNLKKENKEKDVATKSPEIDLTEKKSLSKGIVTTAFLPGLNKKDADHGIATIPPNVTEAKEKHINETTFRPSEDEKHKIKTTNFSKLINYEDGIRKNQTVQPNRFVLKNLYDKTSIELLPGLRVNWFKDVAINRTMYNLRWHPHFPDMPFKTNVMTSLHEKKYIRRQYARRVHGFLIVNETDQYEFQFGSRDGMEVFLLDTYMNVSNFTKLKDIHQMEVLVNKSFAYDEMIDQDKRISSFDVFKKFQIVNLEKNKLYFLDIIQGGKGYGRIQIQWRKNQNESFEDISSNCLFHEVESSIQKHRPTLFIKPVQQIEINNAERLRMSFYEREVLQIRKSSNLKSCMVFHRIKKHVPPNIGTVMTDQWAMYPEEGFGYYKPFNKTHVVLSEQEALDIANQTFNAVNKEMNNTLLFKDIVHVQKNFDHNFKQHAPKNQFYFIEYDVVSKNDQKTYRISNYVRNENNNLCFMKDFQWKEKTKIYLITPVRNQAPWVHYLIQSLEDVMVETHETNIELVLIDYNSTDINVEELLKLYTVPYKYKRVHEKLFNKVQGINIALDEVDNNSIAFILDLHLQLPNNIFDRIRKHTIEGISGYCPTLLKLWKGVHQQFTPNGFLYWMPTGYGMMSLYKSDWTILGGMNEKEFGTAWGGEDWELLDRLIRNGYYLFHAMLPRFYHVFHSNKNTWDGTKN